MSQGAPGAPKV